MLLMVVMGALLVFGVAVTVRWGGTGYRAWDRGPGARAVALRYLRGTAVGVVAGFWTGLLVTGPAIRLIMRLLAVTAGDDAQGRITEADEVVGSIDVDGTVALILFSAVLPGLLSGVIYVAGHRWLPAGRLAGVTFGGLHLVVAATRLDPLRPGNPDFDLVGPGWLAVLTFGLAAILHGMAIAAIANRYSAALPPEAGTRAAWARALAPLVLPALLLVAGVVLLAAVALGLVVTVALSQVAPVVRAVRSRTALVAGRVAVGLLTLALLPGALSDVHDIIVRDEPAASPAPG